MSEYVLGVSAYYHDSAAALIKDGEIIAAAQEEGFTRKKHSKKSYRKIYTTNCVWKLINQKRVLAYDRNILMTLPK